LTVFAGCPKLPAFKAPPIFVAGGSVSAVTQGGRAPSDTVINVIIALLCLVWGSTWLAIKAGLRDLPPLTSASIRFTLAAIVFAMIVPWLRGREGGTRPPKWLVVVMGLVSFAIPYSVVYIGETVLPSGLAAVLWAVFPIMMAISSHYLLPGERLVAGHWFGFSIGFVGVILLFLTDLRDIGPEAVGAGAFFLLSPFVSAIGTTLVKRYGATSSSLLLNRGGLAIAAVALSVGALTSERGAEIRWTGLAIFSIVYLAIAGTVVTFGLFYWLLRFAPAHRLSLIAYVVPAVALFLGWALGDEVVGVRTLAGAGLILLGIGLVARSRARA
jgi:drug/metabolite transporter (DMT)-like permease